MIQRQRFLREVEILEFVRTTAFHLRCFLSVHATALLRARRWAAVLTPDRRLILQHVFHLLGHHLLRVPLGFRKADPGLEERTGDRFGVALNVARRASGGGGRWRGDWRGYLDRMCCTRAKDA